MIKMNFTDLEYRLLKYLLKNGGRPDEIDISPFLKKNIKTEFQFIYSRLEHNLNTSGFAKIRVFQKLDENRLPYSIFLGTLTENGKIYLEQRFEKKRKSLDSERFFYNSHYKCNYLCGFISCFSREFKKECGFRESGVSIGTGRDSIKFSFRFFR